MSPAHNIGNWSREDELEETLGFPNGDVLSVYTDFLNGCLFPGFALVTRKLSHGNSKIPFSGKHCSAPSTCPSYFRFWSTQSRCLVFVFRFCLSPFLVSDSSAFRSRKEGLTKTSEVEGELANAGQKVEMAGRVGTARHSQD